MSIKKLFILLLLSVSFLFISCNKGDSNSKRKDNNRVINNKSIKKKIKKENPKKLLLSMKIDRAKTPYAGVWEPTGDSGFLLLYPDGKLELYSKYDQECKRAPKKKGTYKLLDKRNLEVRINGKTETKKLEVISSFVKIKGLGVFLLPQWIKLKEEQKEYTNPKELIKFCRNVNEGSISKIYHYLTSKSKLELLKIGIIDEASFKAYEKYTDSIANFLNKYKKIISIKSVKKDGDSEKFNIILKDMDGVTYKEEMTVKKENNNLKCGFFDNFKLVSSKKNIKNISFWYKDLASRTKEQVFRNLKTNKTINIQFNGKNIVFKTSNLELNGEFKIIVNTANVVAISVKNIIKDDKKEEKEEYKKENKLDNIIVFKLDKKENISIVFNNEIYVLNKAK